MAFVVAALHTAHTTELVRAVLACEGHTSVLFETGRPALAEAAAGLPDVLIVEAGLSDMTIAQVRATMRSQPSTADITIVVYAPDGAPETTPKQETTPGAGEEGAAADSGRHTLVATRPSELRTVLAATLAQAPTTVLVVEDDASIAEPLIDGLTRYGFAVEWVATGRAALSAPTPAMVLLDLGLPDLDGLEVCRQLRSTSDVPVIMLTARGDECDRVVGLELGADDYLAKPFSVRELVARIRAVHRRTRPADELRTLVRP